MATEWVLYQVQVQSEQYLGLVPLWCVAGGRGLVALGGLTGDRFQEVKTGLAAQHKWIPVQALPFTDVVLYAYAADRTHFPTYVCLPSELYKARTGQVVAQTGPEQEILPLPGIYFFDEWRVHPTLPIPGHLFSIRRLRRFRQVVQHV